MPNFPAAPPARRAKPAKRPGRAKTVLARPTPRLGWDTSDEHELELRRWRGRTEVVAVEALEPDHTIFGDFRARSDSGRDYVVEIRSLDGFDNACGCIDHRVNGLGTCKQERYEDYRVNAARLANIAKRRPLTPKEFDRLQMLLACMRMICDTPAILDPACRICPKLEELEKILGDLLADPERLRDFVKDAVPAADANRVFLALRSPAPADAPDLTQSAARLLAALRER